MSETRVPAIPAPTDANLREVARAIKAVLDVREGLLGDPLDANVTFRDLQDGGVIQTTVVRRSGSGSSGGSVSVAPGAGPSGSAYDPTTDLNPPPAPEGLAASGAISSIVLTWSALPAGYINHAYTEVWRASTNVLGSAVMVGTTSATVYADSLDPGQTRFYWVRHRSQADVVGPYNATVGVSATTGQDPSAMVAAMTGAGKPFTVLTEPTVIGGVTFPAGIYSTLAFVQDAQVTNAKIKDLAVDDAKIADLSVEKLNGAQMKVGAFIQSTNYTSGASGNGWRINADGTAELQAAFIRGQLVASQINGNGLVIRDNSGNPILSAGSVEGTMSVAATAGAGFRVGNLTWDASGNRTGGAGVAMTPGGLLGHNGTKVTFSINAGNGSAFFDGTLGARIVETDNLVLNAATVNAEYTQQISQAAFTAQPSDPSSSITVEGAWQEFSGVRKVSSVRAEVNYAFEISAPNSGANFLFVQSWLQAQYQDSNNNWLNFAGGINEFFEETLHEEFPQLHNYTNPLGHPRTWYANGGKRLLLKPLGGEWPRADSGAAGQNKIRVRFMRILEFYSSAKSFVASNTATDRSRDFTGVVSTLFTEVKL